MTWMLAAILLQVPSLEEAKTAALPCEEPLLIAASSTGKFVVLADAKSVFVLEGETLKLVREIGVECAAAAFDPKDEVLTLVGKQTLRFETKEWMVVFRAELPDVAFREASDVVGRMIVNLQQEFPPDAWLGVRAMVSPDGAIYYRSKGGLLSVAREREGKLVSEILVKESRDGRSPVVQLFAVPPGPILLQLGGEAGVALREQAYTLTASNLPLATWLRGTTASLVTRNSLNTYTTTTWKCQSVQQAEGNKAAVFDAKRGCFYVARKWGLRYWDGRREGVEKAIDGVGGEVHSLAIDGAATRVYGIGREELHLWRIRD